MQYKKNWVDVKKRYQRWWEKKLERPLLSVVWEKFQPGECAWNGWRLVHSLDDPGAAVADYEKYCSRSSFELDAYPNISINFGPGIIAAWLGADAEIYPDTVWLKKTPPLAAGEQIVFNPDSTWYHTARKITNFVAESGRGRYVTGICSHSGVLDVLASLRGSEQLLMDMKENPGQVREWSACITDYWLQFFHEFYGIIKAAGEGFSSPMPIWSTESWYPVQCDLAAMFSPADFAEFVMPDLRRLTKELHYSIYHLDGPGQIAHLAQLLDLPDLDGIQWIPGAGSAPPDAPCWFPMLRRIQAAGKLLVLLDIDLKNLPRLFDNIDARHVLVTGTTRDGNDVELAAKFI